MNKIILKCIFCALLSGLFMLFIQKSFANEFDDKLQDYCDWITFESETTTSGHCFIFFSSCFKTQTNNGIYSKIAIDNCINLTDKLFEVKPKRL